MLYLSEEDFQKVRTNRKKRNNINKDHMIDEDIIATKTIMHCQNDNDQLQNTVTEEYIINNDTTDGDKNWKSSDAIQIIRNCFETYEVCQESHLNKTESIETELPIKNRISNKDENNLSAEYTDKVQDKLQSASYIKLEIVRDGNNQLICHDNTDQSEIIYHNINEAPSYIKVEYSNLINTLENENNLEFQETLKFSENQIKNPIQIINKTENYFSEESNSVSEQTSLMQVKDTHIETKNKDSNKHIILSQEHIKYKKENSNITTLDCKSFQEMETHEIAVSEDLIDLNTLQEINQVANKTISTVTGTLVNQNENCLLQENKKLSNYQTVIKNLIENRAITSSNYISEKDNKKLLNQVEQRLYIHNEPLTSIMVQNKCINILPQTQSKIQLNKNQKFTSLNKHMQTINVKQSENQNTILLLTNNALQNNVFKIDHNMANNEIKE